MVGSAPAFDQLLWYAREGANLVHAGEAIVLSGSDERQSLRQAYVRLTALARKRRLQGVERFFAEEIERTNAVEAQGPDDWLVAPRGEHSRALLVRRPGHAPWLLNGVLVLLAPWRRRGLPLNVGRARVRGRGRVATGTSRG